MVLGLTLRRRKTKEEPPTVRASPSLPNIAATGLSTKDWPEGLDIATIKQQVVAASDDGHEDSAHGDHPVRAFKTSLSQGFQGVPSFHRPFRPDQQVTSSASEGGYPRRSIASMYSAPPSAFSNFPPVNSKGGPRRIVRVPPKFNVMVAGGQGTGKTSFLKLLLNTCDISPTAPDGEVAALKKFTEVKTRHTKSLRTISVEVCEERHERVQLTVIDTVGFVFQEGRELELERGVQTVVKYLDAQYAETMGEESKVVRQNKGDKHVHLCIYLIDPETIQAPAARRRTAALQYKSQTTLIRRASLSSMTSSDTSDSSSDEVDLNGLDGEKEKDAAPTPRKKDGRRRAPETMAPAEIAVLKRLSTRCNILPVIAKADTLSDTRLALVRSVVRRDLADAGLGFGVFEPAPPPATRTNGKSRKVQVVPQTPPSQHDEEDEAEDDDEDDEDRVSRPVIKLRSPRTPLNRDRSRSRRRLLGLDEDEEHPTQPGTEPQTPAEDGYPASAWPTPSKGEIAAMLPFAIISPEDQAASSHSHGRKRSKSQPVPPLPNGLGPSLSPEMGSEPPTSSTNSVINSPQLVGGTMRRRPSFKDVRVFIRSPAELQDTYVRQYRWGTIDSMNPRHCDFVALRGAVLGSHLKALKNQTKEVLYEKYRTEKLLARRATRDISDADRTKLLSELGV